MRVGVIEDPRELGGRVAHCQGHRQATGAPDAPLGRHMVPARMGEVADTGALEVIPPCQQRPGHGGRRANQIGVGEHAFRADHRDAVTMGVGGRE